MATQKMVVFQLADEEYCLNVQNVKSIERMLPITRVPRVSPFVKGVINLRGVVTPVIDLRLRLELPATDYTEKTRIIMVVLDDMDVGLIVDGAHDVVDINEEAIEPPPEVVGNTVEDYIEGVCQVENRLLTILNLAKVLDRKALDGQAAGVEQ